jgi:carbon-monoxide dehydrogenase medium subunit
VYLPTFELTRPETLDQAIHDLAELEGDTSVYMGGTELLLLMKLGMSNPQRLVDCKRLPELQVFDVAEDVLVIGAGLTHAQLHNSEAVKELIPEFSRMENQIANIRVRTAGTIGGNLCFGDPNSDPLTLLLALGATLQVQGPLGRRTLDVQDLVVGMYESALSETEILLNVHVHVPPSQARVVHERIVLRERPVASVSVVCETASDIRVAVGGAGQVGRRYPEIESLLVLHGLSALDDCVALLRDSLRPADDLDGGSDYKVHLAGVLLQRAVRRALA